MARKAAAQSQKPAKPHAKVFEFKPANDITTAEIIELSKVVRIGVGGHVVENLSQDLQKHFSEVTK